MLCSAAVPLLPPTGVTHSVSGHFSAASSPLELIVVAQHKVTLYKTCSSGPSVDNIHASASISRTLQEDKKSPHLRFVMECSLYSPPLAVTTCRPANCGADLIVALFDDAHISFLKYNPRERTFETVGLVQLLDRELLNERCELPPILRVDPTGTYVAVLAKRTTLVAFPLLGFGSRKSQAEKNAYTRDLPGAAVSDEKKIGKGVLQSQTKKVLQLNDWGDSESDEEQEKCAGVESKKDTDELENEERKSNDTQEAGVSVAVNSTEKLQERKNNLSNTVVSTDLLHVGPISSFSLEEISPKIRNVRDFHFVFSSGEPLLVVLYEKYPTWAGRLKVLEWGKDIVENHMLTCSLSWVSISHAQTASPQLLFVGDVDHLSYSTTHILPFSSDQSGGDISNSVICVSNNHVVWVSPQRGVACYINEYGQEEVQNVTTASWTFQKLEWDPPTLETSLDLIKTNINFGNCAIIPLSPSWTSISTTSTGTKSALDPSSSHSVFRVLLITEDEGTAVMLCMHVEGSAVRSMTASILLTGCYCSAFSPLLNGILFIGSCCSDSLIVDVTDGNEGLAVVEALPGPPTISPIYAVTQVDASYTSLPLSSHSGERWSALPDRQGLASPYDTLFRNVPIPVTLRDHSDPSSLTPDAQDALTSKITDIAVVFGKGASGSLGILRQSVRDQLVPTGSDIFASAVFFIPGSTSNPKKEQSQGPQQDYLLTSGPNFSAYFCIHDRIEQVRSSAIRTRERTVYAAALQWKPSSVLQVTEKELVLISLDGTSAFHSAVIETLLLVPQQPCGPIRSVFQVPSEQSVYILFQNGVLAAVRVKPSSFIARVIQEGVSAAAYWKKSNRVVVLSHEKHLIVYRPKGHQELLRFPFFGLLPMVSEQDVPISLSAVPSRHEKDALPLITDLYIFDHPLSSPSSTHKNDGGATLICILSSGELVTYEHVMVDSFGGNRWIKNVFHFLDVDPEVEVMQTLEGKKQRLETERRNKENKDGAEEQTSQEAPARIRISEFTNIHQQRGVYVCGKHPVFLFFDSTRSQLSLCRHHTTGTVQHFSFFDTPHAPGGYMYCVEHHARIQFALPAPSGSYIGNGWWIRTTPLGETPHQVFHVPEAQSCMVVTSCLEPFAPQKASFDLSLNISLDAEGNKSVTIRPNPSLPPLTSRSSAPTPLNSRYSIKLIQCKSAVEYFEDPQDEQFEEVVDTLQLEANEKVLCGRMLQLRCNISVDGVSETLSNVYAFGTGFPLGEDITTVGRLLLLTTRWVGNKYVLQVLHSEGLKGPVTAVAAINHHIAVAVAGTIRVFSFDFKNKKCDTVAMLYAGAYITTLSSLKEYLFFGDLFSSITMVRFSATHRTLTVLGKDFHRFSAVQCEPMYHERNFGVVSTDAQRNVVFFGYTPRVQEMRDGNRVVLESILTVDSEYRVPGGSVSQLLRFRSCTRGNSSRILYTTNYGEIGVFVGLSNSANRSLQWVVQRLQSNIPHTAGLTPQVFFSIPKKCPRWDLAAKQRVIYAPLIDNLYRLDLRTRKALAAAALTQVDKTFRIGITLQMDAWIL